MRGKYSKILLMWLWMSLWLTDSSVLEDPQDTEMLSPVKVWTVHVLYHSYHSLNNMGFTLYLCFCTGDSGGSLFLRKRNRYFQVSTFLTKKKKKLNKSLITHSVITPVFIPKVGVVTWGITDVCSPAQTMYSSDRPPPDARDFHIDLFKIMPWLKQHLGEDIQFLPDII